MHADFDGLASTDARPGQRCGTLFERDAELDERELDQIGASENALERELERDLLAKKLTPAKPVGLRYDRMAGEGLVWTERETILEPSEIAPMPAQIVASRSCNGLLPGPSRDVRRTSGEASYWYFLCNRLLISSLLARCKNVLVASGEGWLPDLSCCEEREGSEEKEAGEGRDVRQAREARDAREEREAKEATDARAVVRVCLSSFGAPAQNDSVIRVETYEQFAYREGSFDGVLVDSSILLSGNVRASLKEFRRILKPGGRVCVVTPNWEYEMAGRAERYETSFRRYGSKIYLGLLKRTLYPPQEIEYVCLLDSRESAVKKLASMERQELRALVLADVPGAAKTVVSAELIEIPQLTRAFLQEACIEAGFTSVSVSGAPGILAFGLFKGVFLSGSTPAARGESGAGSAGWTTPCDGSAGTPTPALPLFGDSSAIMNEISRHLAHSFPFVAAIDNPHIVALCAR